jgi:ferredoxin-NADP reductase/ferredoxin
MFRIVLFTRDGAPVGFDADPSETLLDAAARWNIFLPSGCREGACGTCRVMRVGGQVNLDPTHVTAPTDADNPGDDVLLCCSKALSDLELRAPFDRSAIEFSAGHHRSARIVTVTPSGAGAIRLVLQYEDSPGCGRVAAFIPGQYMEVSIPDTPVTRAYSLANTPNCDGTLEFLIRLHARGAFSDYLTTRAAIGNQLILRGPLGGFAIDKASDSPRWFIAGGTGLAPILSMLRDLANSQDPRACRLFFGVNREEELFALDAIQDVKNGLPQLRATVCVWTPMAGWKGFVGTPADALALSLADANAQPDVYVCGPQALIEATRLACAFAGIARDRVFSEQFAPAPAPALLSS